jgi:fructose-specific phosphotransferase system IIA component
VNVSDLLNDDLVETGLAASSKEDLIEKMIDLLAHSKNVVDKEKVREAILERERIMSTGVGNGFAIPHGKSDGVSDLCAAFATTAEPVDYQSLDEQPVRLVFILVTRGTMVGPHIKVLSRMSRLMNKEDVRKRLLHASSPADVLSIFHEEEAKFHE